MTANNYRAQAAEAFRARLLGGTPAGANVHTKLDRAMRPDELPALLVYANDARRGPQDYGNSVVPRVLSVTIEGAVQADAASALDAADALVEAVELLIEADPSLGNAVQNTRWQRSMTDVTSHGQTTLGVCLLQYDVEMLTHMRTPDAFGVGDDGFSGTPVVVYTLPDTTPPLYRDAVRPDPALECGPDGCAPDAWGGEVKPNGEPIV